MLVLYLPDWQEGKANSDWPILRLLDTKMKMATTLKGRVTCLMTLVDPSDLSGLPRLDMLVTQRAELKTSHHDYAKRFLYMPAFAEPKHAYGLECFLFIHVLSYACLSFSNCTRM